MRSSVLILVVVLSAFLGYLTAAHAQFGGKPRCNSNAIPCDFVDSPNSCCMSTATPTHAMQTDVDPDWVNTDAPCGFNFTGVLGYCINPQFTPCGSVASGDCSG